jgi:Tfp pilus assembly protein FimT
MLMMATVPRFQQTAQRLQTEQTAFTLTQHLRYAHERAVAQGDRVVWVWDAQERQAHLEVEVVQSDDSTQRSTITGNIARSRPVRGEITVTLAHEGSEGSDNEVTFYSDGRSQATTLQIAHRTATYTVTIDAATGQSTLTSGASER